MPLLRRDGKTGAVALTKDKERVLAYSLTPAALRRLRDHGVRIGGALPSSILVALIRAGDAHSPRPAEAAGQGQLFGDDDTADHLPRCETTGTTADLHLVVHTATGAPVAQLLCADARFVLRKSTSLSVPIWLLSTRLLDQLETSAQLPRDADATARLRQWFRRDHEDAWARLEKSVTQQSALALGSSSDELPLPG